jgi:hypothetical protein
VGLVRRLERGADGGVPSRRVVITETSRCVAEGLFRIEGPSAFLLIDTRHLINI